MAGKADPAKAEAQQTLSDDRASVACAICRAPASRLFQPFCSRLCADRDLLRWLGGGYLIAGTETNVPLNHRGASANAGDWGEDAPDDPQGK